MIFVTSAEERISEATVTASEAGEAGAAAAVVPAGAAAAAVDAGASLLAAGVGSPQVWPAL
jgi:hypothetical protein